MQVYACYISGTYLQYFEAEAEAQVWASTTGLEHQGYWLQGQYEPLQVSVATGHALLTEQPCIGHEEALAYV